MPTAPTICIDFGSSRTKVAWFNEETGKPELIELGNEVRAVLPTVFYLPMTDQGGILVGDHAVDMANNDAAGLVTDIKREIHRPGKVRCGAGRVTAERWELARTLFAHIRERCQREVFHRQTVESCVLTVPVCFNELQRGKLRQAAEAAGFTSIRMTEEPVAAAMHWLSSSGRKHSPYVIVIDIGGGTTDMAALKLATGNRYEPIPDLQHAGIPIGGNDIDAMLRDAVMQVMPQEAERAGGWLVKLRSLKERLARDTCAMFHVTVHAQACEVPREIVDAKVREFADRVQAAAGKFIEDFTELTGNRDCPILLAGGGSRLTGMQEAIESSTPPAKGRVMLWSDGDYAIVKGGVIQTSPPPKKTTVAVPPPLPIAHKKETVVVSKPIKPKVTEKLLDDDRVSQLRQEFQQQQQVEADRKFKEDAARQANEDYLKKIWNRANPQPRPSNNSNTTHQAKVADKIKKGCVLWIIAWLLLLLFINIIKLIK